MKKMPITCSINGKLLNKVRDVKQMPQKYQIAKVKHICAFLSAIFEK